MARIIPSWTACLRPIRSLFAVDCVIENSFRFYQQFRQQRGPASWRESCNDGRRGSKKNLIPLRPTREDKNGFCSFFSNCSQWKRHPPLRRPDRAVSVKIIEGFKSVRENCKLQDSWWKPPHLCGGRSASALRETVSTRSLRFSAGSDRAVLYALYSLRKTRFVSGHDFSRAIKAQQKSGL
jgi:hypothetical protein